jgi:protein MpaA
VRAALLTVATAGALGVPTASLAAATRAETIGRSVEGRAIRLVRIGQDAAPVRVLVVGCIHGTETAGMAVTRALRRRATAPDGVQLLVLDALNPDGCARGTRGNARGVDLNRNFPWGWRAQSGIFASGPRAASEPETRAAQRLVSRARPRVTIWFHQHMDLVEETPGSDPALVRRYARTARMRVRRLARLPGTASRWQEHALPATTSFVVELPAGRLPAAAIARHVAAIDALARAATA